MEKLIKQFKKYWFFFGLLLLALTIVGIDSWTKYVTEKQEDGIVKGVEMFFTSDVLKEESASPQDYTVVDWKDGSAINFELRNYPDSERYTERDIEYTLSAKVGDTDVDGAVFEDHQNNTGEIPESTSSSEQHKNNIKVSFPGLFSGNETEKIVTITATTTAPYAGYQLSAKFLIKKADEKKYSISIKDEIDSPYVAVTINANISQDLTLTWDDSVIVPDQTNSIFKADIESDTSAFGGEGKTIKLDTITDGGSVTFLMLKYDNTVYNADTYTGAFTITPNP